MNLHLIHVSAAPIPQFSTFLIPQFFLFAQHEISFRENFCCWTWKSTSAGCAGGTYTLSCGTGCKLFHFVPFWWYFMLCPVIHTFLVYLWLKRPNSTQLGRYKIISPRPSRMGIFSQCCCCWLTVQFIESSYTSLQPYKYENCITDGERRKIENKVLRMLAISFRLRPMFSTPQALMDDSRLVSLCEGVARIPKRDRKADCDEKIFLPLHLFLYTSTININTERKFHKFKLKLRWEVRE